MDACEGTYEKIEQIDACQRQERNGEATRGQIRSERVRESRLGGVISQTKKTDWS